MNDSSNNINTGTPLGDAYKGMSPQFLAAMRLNAMSRGMKWIETYDMNEEKYAG